MPNTELTARFAKFDFIVAIDASAAMLMTDTPDGSSRWNQAQASTATIVGDLCSLDDNGIDVVVFGGDNVSSFEGVTRDKVAEVFASVTPAGAANLDAGLAQALTLAAKCDKQDFILVVTAGEYTQAEKDAAAARIVAATQSQAEDADLTVLFLQVGASAEATEYLSHLDDNLVAAGAKFDIVDSKSVVEAAAFPSTVELVAAAIAD